MVPISPEEEACLQIISDYQRGELSLEVAAERLREASRALKNGINLEMTPSVHRLFTEAARLEGLPFPDYLADPDRHAKRGSGDEMLDSLEAWTNSALSDHPRADQPISVSIHFAAATEAAALRIKSWLESHGNHRVRIKSPTQADADDWIIRGDTPRTIWTPAAVAQWAAWMRETPLNGEASLRGTGL